MKRAVATNERDESGQAAKTVADAIYANLRRDLLNGKWPPGSPLRSAALRLAYGVGISPLREALTRLVGDRLVTVEGQRGFRVAPVSLAELQDVMRLRADLEAMALRAAIERGDGAWEEAIRASFEALADAPAGRLPGSRHTRPQPGCWSSRAAHSAPANALSPAQRCGRQRVRPGPASPSPSGWWRRSSSRPAAGPAEAPRRRQCDRRSWHRAGAGRRQAGPAPGAGGAPHKASRSRG